MTDEEALKILAPYWDLPEAKEKWPHWPPRTNYYEHYVRWSREIQPKTYLEIGIMYGWSVMAVILGCPTIKHITLIDNEFYGIPGVETKKRIEEFCIDQGFNIPAIDFIKADSRNIRMLTPKYYDVIQIDGCHSEDAVYSDLKLCAPAVTDRGMIIVDDLSLPGIKVGADRFLNTHLAYKGEVVQTHQVHYLIRRV